jgi:hypothetical protein
MLVSCVSYASVELPLESGKRKSEMEGNHCLQDGVLDSYYAVK